MIDWLNVNERTPKLIDGISHSRDILICDNGVVRVGYYEKDLYVWWAGSFCNTDRQDSQDGISHWAVINYPKGGE